MNSTHWGTPPAQRNICHGESSRARRSIATSHTKPSDAKTAKGTAVDPEVTNALRDTFISLSYKIYGTAAVLVFPALFFPTSDPVSARLASLATFGIAFLARPIGSALFGHFGDRIGRKATLVAALLTMGVSTVTIGLVPSYAKIGILAPLLLALCRFGQGLGLGGEWGGAVAPRGRERAAREARVVRHVPPARRAARVLLLGRNVPAAFRPPDR
jgi:hypothetical protein